MEQRGYCDMAGLAIRSTFGLAGAAQALNQALTFDEVRWATMRKTSYDARSSFQQSPEKMMIDSGAKLFRLVQLVNGRYFDSPWWMPENAFEKIRQYANGSLHGSGRLLRNYIAQYFALPVGDTQLCVVEIELTSPVYAWIGTSAALFRRPGGMPQIFLPNLNDRGNPRFSPVAKVMRTYWLQF